MIFSPIFQDALLRRAAALHRNVKLPSRYLGTILPASATAQLLWALASKPQRFWTYADILAEMAEKKSLNWSLRYAHAMGWIERTPDTRTSRYLRYRITWLGLEKLR